MILHQLICVPHHTWTIKKIYIVDFSGLKCDVVGKLGGVNLLGIFVVILQKAIQKTQENMSNLVADGNGIEVLLVNTTMSITWT